MDALNVPESTMIFELGTFHRNRHIQQLTFVGTFEPTESKQIVNVA